MKTLDAVIVELTKPSKCDGIESLLLDARRLKELTRILRRHNTDDPNDIKIYRHCVHSIKAMERSDTSKQRWLALLLVDALVERSSRFRRLYFGENLFHVLRDLAGVVPNVRLPPPARVSEMLHERCLECVERWHHRFADCYIHLRLAVDFLNMSLQIRLPGIVAMRRRRERQEARRAERGRLFARRQFDEIVRKADDAFDAMLATLREMSASFDLLMPNVASSSPSSSLSSVAAIDDDDALSSTNVGGFARAYGLANLSYELVIDVPTTQFGVVEDDNNSAIFEALRDSLKLAENRYLPLIRQWEVDIMRTAADAARQQQQSIADHRAKQQLLQRLSRYRLDFQVARRKCHELGIQVKEKASQASGEQIASDAESDSDSDDSIEWE
jgi:UVSSA N-terminal domain